MVTTGQLLGFGLASLVLIVVPDRGAVRGRAGPGARAPDRAGHSARSRGGQLHGGGVRGRRAGRAAAAVGRGVRDREDRGALYLIWLGVHAIRHRKSLADAMAVATPPREGWRAARDGAVVGLTNPKAYILFGAILPQFVNRAARHVPEQMLVLALVSVAIGAVSDCSWGFAASAVRAWFARSPRRSRWSAGPGAWP